MKKLFTLFMLLGLLSAPAFGQDADYGQQESSATPTAATFCKEDAVAKEVSTDAALETQSKGSKVEQKDEG